MGGRGILRVAVMLCGLAAGFGAAGPAMAQGVANAAVKPALALAQAA